MKKNLIAMIIRWIGWITIFAGSIGFSIILNEMHAESFIVVGILLNVISGVMLLGFSEIINLLQLNVDNTETLTKSLPAKQG